MLAELAVKLNAIRTFQYTEEKMKYLMADVVPRALLQLDSDMQAADDLLAFQGASSSSLASSGSSSSTVLPHPSSPSAGLSLKELATGWGTSIKNYVKLLQEDIGEGNIAVAGAAAAAQPSSSSSSSSSALSSTTNSGPHQSPAIEDGDGSDAAEPWNLSAFLAAKSKDLAFQLAEFAKLCCDSPSSSTSSPSSATRAPPTVPLVGAGGSFSSGALMSLTNTHTQGRAARRSAAGGGASATAGAGTAAENRASASSSSSSSLSSSRRVGGAKRPHEAPLASSAASNEAPQPPAKKPRLEEASEEERSKNRAAFFAAKAAALTAEIALTSSLSKEKACEDKVKERKEELGRLVVPLGEHVTVETRLQSSQEAEGKAREHAQAASSTARIYKKELDDMTSSFNGFLEQNGLNEDDGHSSVVTLREDLEKVRTRHGNAVTAAAKANDDVTAKVKCKKPSQQGIVSSVVARITNAQ
jgi:hypothetical protein